MVISLLGFLFDVIGPTVALGRRWPSGRLSFRQSQCPPTNRSKGCRLPVGRIEAIFCFPPQIFPPRYRIPSEVSSVLPSPPPFYFNSHSSPRNAPKLWKLFRQKLVAFQCHLNAVLLSRVLHFGGQSNGRTEHTVTRGGDADDTQNEMFVRIEKEWG